MRIIFYSDKKRGNSTYRPSSGGVEKNCRLKGATSVEAPFIIIDEPCTEIFTLAYIPTWKRWYSVTSVTSMTADTTGYQLNVDVLATYKEQILDTTTWVERSASEIDLNQFDGMWTHNGSIVETNDKTIDIFGSQSTWMPDDLPEMWYIVSVVNGGGNEGVTRYLMDLGQFKHMVSALFSPATYSSLSLTGEIQTYFNPFQYVTSVRLFPFQPPFSNAGETLHFGWYTSTIETTGIVSVYGEEFDYDFVPGGKYNNFTNRSSEWTRITGYCPGIGDFEIDPSYYGKQLHGHLYCDFVTGAVYYRLTYSGSLIMSSSGKIGVDVQLSQLSVDSMKIKDDKYQASTGYTVDALTGLGSLVGNLMTGNWGGAASSLGGLANLDHKQEMRELQLKKDTCSPALSLAGTWDNVYASRTHNKAEWHCFFYVPEHKPTQEIGGVLNRRIRLGALSGFTKVMNGAIDINATYNEKITLQQLLEGGFFIE